MPGDLLVFACERLIAAGGEENLTDVETWLREWLIRNSESQQFDETLKAQVQLLLARGYFKAQRYDVARAEFTTVINRYPKTPQALEAQFGIGETYVAQKVYDQALAVFERLAQSRDTDVVVRAEFLRGVVAFQRGDVDEARDIFRAVLDRVPSIELADKALFRLSEIYGLEQRYLEQLTLLRTVGRLGRTSKRSHVPGQPLAIVVYDSDLGISRGHNRIPVIVTTEPGGDKELVYLTSAGAGKGLFRADLDTRLGQAAPNNRILELTGRDTVRCDYPEEFRAQFRRVPLSDVQIQVAADGKLEVASTKEFEEKKTTFSEELQKEVQQPQTQADQRVSQTRPLNQIKPGNPLYVRVTDPDRDLTNEPDPVIVKVAGDSGDQVQATLQETGPHTGVFEGHGQDGRTARRGHGDRRGHQPRRDPGHRPRPEDLLAERAGRPHAQGPDGGHEGPQTRGPREAHRARPGQPGSRPRRTAGQLRRRVLVPPGRQSAARIAWSPSPGPTAR